MKSVTKVDDYTVRFDFEKPFPNFMYATRGFAGGERGGDGINGTHERSPAHYMKKFHPDYAPMPGMSPQAQYAASGGQEQGCQNSRTWRIRKSQ